VDITCDSDGKVDAFISTDGVQKYLELHATTGDPYYLGVFLTGAYQDILGDMHNLFGRVSEVHVYADEEESENFYIEKTIIGTTVTEAVSLVQYFPSDLQKRMDQLIREKVRARQIRATQGVAFLELYKKGLEEYTYYNFWDASFRVENADASPVEDMGSRDATGNADRNGAGA
jgi:arginine decarboxylase